MQTQYIYSTSRTNTLAQYLLTMTDIDRLLVARAGDDLHSALKEMYLAPYLSRVHDEDMTAAIEQTLIEAKKLVHKIAPNGDIFRVLWVQYDIHNLRVLAKAKATSKDFDALVPFMSARGIHEPATLLAYAETSQLDSVYPNWQSTYEQATRHAVAGELDRVDGLFDQLFFATVMHIAQAANDAFILRYMQTMIDLFNLKSALRTTLYPQIAAAPTFARGGAIAAEVLTAGIEQIIPQFDRYGGQSFWQPAIEQYQQTKNSTMLDARVDDYLLTVAKLASVDMFSSASLVLYYLQVRQSAANIRTIVVGKNSGMSEAAIRSNLRLAYVN